MGTRGTKKVASYLDSQIKKLGNKPFLITGDLNLPSLADCNFDPLLHPVQDQKDMTFDHIWSDLVKTHDLVQHVTEPIHNKGNILDYVFASSLVDIPVLMVDACAIDPRFNHYAIIFFCLYKLQH